MMHLLLVLVGGAGTTKQLWVDQVFPGNLEDISVGNKNAALQSGCSSSLPLPVG